MSADTKSNTYALVLGINRYQGEEWPDLHAAVSDANSFEDFLCQKLNVPPSHIISLRNEEASRERILKALASDLPHITSDCVEDPAIIIYYAGHGASTEKPQGWETWATNSNNIEMLCPSDMGLLVDEDVIEGIPDRTICHLLNNLSRARGNNITLILDCCCSAGINRSATNPASEGYVARRIQHPPPISANVDGFGSTSLDGDTTRSTEHAPGGFTGRFQDSHVLMAACGREQLAYEKEGKGLFTQRLLLAFDAVGVLTTTYDGLLPRLSMPKWQTPHFEGKNLNRLLFNMKGGRSDPFLIPGRRKKIDGVPVVSLEAGAAQGILEGSLFDIYAKNLLELGNGPRTNAPIGRMMAAAVDAFTTRLVPLPDLRFTVPPHFFARWDDSRVPVRIFSEDREWLEQLFPESVRSELGVLVTGEKDQASLSLRVHEDSVYFDRNDGLAQPYIGSRFPRGVRRNSSQAVHEVVRKWKRFNYHLTRPSPLELRDVRMELHYLEAVGNDEWDEPIYEPRGHNLLASEPAMIEVQGDYVGITLHNQGDTPLYPFLFYFDPNDLTIVPWHSTPLGAGEGKHLVSGVDSPLPPHSNLPLGYGNGGAPWEFILDGKEKDLGFFKLYVSTSPANFTSLEQTVSPFDEPVGLSRGGQTEGESSLDEWEWGSKTFTLIQTSKALH